MSLMFLCRLYSVDCALVKRIGTNLHNLEELFLVVSEEMKDNSDVIKYLVTGCPKLRLLHVDWNVLLEAVQYMLLSLPNLIEFKHSLMVFALVDIIQDGRADRVSAIRNLYIGTTNFGNFGVRDFLKFVPIVMKHLNNITNLDITIAFNHYKESITTFYVALSNLTQLTELTLKNHTNDTVHLLPIIEANGHQLELLNCSCRNFTNLDVIGQCRKLRVLRIKVRISNTSNMNGKSYGSDLQEAFTPFYHLQKLHLVSISDAHLNSVLLNSLIASPVLQELKLVSTSIVTDHILKAAFNYLNEDGEQLAFTSLRYLELEHLYIDDTDYFINIVTHERAPLEVLAFNEKAKISKIARRNLERCDIEIIDISLPDIYDFY